MALFGVHIECGFAGGQGLGDTFFALRRELIWSETMANPGTTALPAPKGDATIGNPIFSIVCSSAIFYAIGNSPDATTGARRYLASGFKEDIFVKPDQRLAWVLA